MNKKKKKKLNIRNIVLAGIILVILIYLLILIIKLIVPSKTMYIASSTNITTIFNENFEPVKELTRGSSIKVKMSSTVSDGNGNTYIKYNEDSNTYLIKKENIVEKQEKTILETKLYVKTAASVLTSETDNKIIGLIKKGEEVEIVSYNKILSDGTVDIYHVKNSDINGYVYGKYLTWTKELAEANYNADELDVIHEKIKDTYGGGNALNLDYYPVNKPNFSNNVMPESVYALYLNNNSSVLKKVDSYIEFAKETNINTFVVDIKDDNMPGYKSKVMEELSPTNYKKANNSFDEYKNAIKKLKDAGFYVVGRITVFKDSYYVKDHEENAIKSIDTGKPYYHNNAYWPTPYARDVWYFNVELAKEAITEMGFNEINFDYVRFPDKLQSKANLIDLQNKYNEDKAEAIQRFLQYATDEIHKLNVYVSVDVFGESTNGNYMTAYGQYWPAISNVVDVICGMPYPDHFSANSYGIAKPWNEPYKIMNAWGKEAVKRQNWTTSPAKVRTWIEAYNSKYGMEYNADEIQNEIQGLFDAGLTAGFITWNNSNTNLDKYKKQADAYKIKYMKEDDSNE